MTDGMAVFLHILGDLMAVLMPVVILTILVVVTSREGRVQTMMEDENKPGLSLKQCVPGIVMTVGIWLVLIVVGYLFIRWAGR